MFRDFSEEAKNDFLGYVEDVTAKSGWGEFWDTISDLEYVVLDWLGKLSITNYLDDVETYHRKILDKNDTTAEQIETIFENVMEVNNTYAALMEELVNKGNEYITRIQNLAECIQPDGGYFDSEVIYAVFEGLDVEELLAKMREPDWLHSVMSLEGTTQQEEFLNSRLSRLKLSWNQEKVDALWEACAQIYYDYGIEVDPRFLLAVIIQEGTGSFNTSSTNLAADGQNGVEENFSVDLMKANALIFGKLLGYIYYGDEFREAVANNEGSFQSEAGDIFDYINWNTPIINVNNASIRTGVYAGHSAWGVGVENIYEKLTYEGAGEEYSEYLVGIDVELLEQILPGCEYKDYTFSAVQNGQNSKGEPDGTWTIVAK